MESLRNIREHLNAYASFLVEIIKADVEIVDASLNRLAATGSCATRQELISLGAVYNEVFRTDRYVIIQNPKRHEVCDRCKVRDRCLEKMEVACPITVDGVTLGAVGVVCAKTEQRDYFMNNLNMFMYLLGSVSDFARQRLIGYNENNDLVRTVNILTVELSELKDRLGGFPADGQIRKLEDIERDEIQKALKLHGTDTLGKQKAAKALGIGIATLYRKINEEK
jgi:transcriptional regulator with PAS, ATPase and Fis domain